MLKKITHTAYRVSTAKITRLTLCKAKVYKKQDLLEITQYWFTVSKEENTQYIDSPNATYEPQKAMPSMNNIDYSRFIEEFYIDQQQEL